MHFRGEAWSEIGGVRVAPGAAWSEPTDLNLRVVVTCVSVEPERFKPAVSWRSNVLCEGDEVSSHGEAVAAGRELVAGALRRLFAR